MAHVSKNHYQAVIQGAPIWTRVDSLDGTPLMINGNQAIRVLGSNTSIQVPGGGTLTIEVLL